MAKIILLCGKVCSGKSTYAIKIQPEYHAVILSADELMLELFEEQLGEDHHPILEKVKHYLYQLAEQIVKTNTHVILDFGFWTRSERQQIKQHYAQKGIITELHYLRVDPEVWSRNIEMRNINLHHTNSKNYYIDEKMKYSFSSMFEEPDHSEIDVEIRIS